MAYQKTWITAKAGEGCRVGLTRDCGDRGWLPGVGGEDPLGCGIQLRATGSQKMALRLGLVQLPGLGGHCLEGGMRDESRARECVSL